MPTSIPDSRVDKINNKSSSKSTMYYSNETTKTHCGSIILIKRWPIKDKPFQNSDTKRWSIKDKLVQNSDTKRWPINDNQV